MKTTLAQDLAEQWLPVVGYEGLYEVCNLGTVRSVDRQTKSRFGLKTSPGRVLKPEVSNVGYYRVNLCKQGVKKHKSIHRLVLEAFKPTEVYRHVNHIDSNRLNNRLDNLEWVTHGENMVHATIFGNLAVGARTGSAKLDDNKVRQILKLLETQSGYSISKKFGVAKSQIYCIKHNRTWRHIERTIR